MDGNMAIGELDPGETFGDAINGDIIVVAGAITKGPPCGSNVAVADCGIPGVCFAPVLIEADVSSV